LASHTSHAVVAVDTWSGNGSSIGWNMTAFPVGFGNYGGACFDGRRIWMAPAESTAQVLIVSGNQSTDIVVTRTTTALRHGGHTATLSSTLSGTWWGSSYTATASSTPAAVRWTRRAASRTAEVSVSSSRIVGNTSTTSVTLSLTEEQIPRERRRLRTATGTPQSIAVPSPRGDASVRGLDRVAVGQPVGRAVTASTVTVSAAASVFTPSAASRPSRLAAVAQTSECNAEFNGEPDRISFPFQATIGESVWVGSIVVNSALLLFTVTTFLALHLPS
jgi:hypothetical protein